MGHSCPMEPYDRPPEHPGNRGAPGGRGPVDPAWPPQSSVPEGAGPGTQVPAGGPAAPRRGGARRWLLLGIAASVLIACSVLVGDWVARNVEANALVDGIESSEAAMVAGMDAVREVAGGADALAPGASDDIARQLQQAATTALAGVTDAADTIEAVPIQPWHPQLLAAREAYLTHNRAWQDYLTGATEDAAGWFESPPAIDSTWQALGPVLRDAVPTPALFDLDKRVEAILDDSQSQDSTTLQAAARG